MYSPLYEKLDTFRKEIRLLVIHPGDYDDDLRFGMVIESLTQKPLIHALSYCWGVENQEQSIWIGDEHLLVTKNVAQAIRRLRSRQDALRLWIDAICINQSNDEERGHQVAMMVDVYSEAALVHVWLGEDFPLSQKSVIGFQVANEDTSCKDCTARVAAVRSNPEWRYPSNRDEAAYLTKRNRTIQDALQITMELAAGKHLHEAMGSCHIDSGGHLVTTSRWMDAMETLVTIIRMPWWGRVWVLQEIILPRNEPVIHFSEHSFGISMIFECCSNFMQHFNTCCRPPSGTISALHSDERQSLLPPVGFEVIRDLRNMKQQFDKGQLSLWRSLQISRTRNTSDLRDHFYGILGLVEPFYRERANVNYRYSVAKVFCRATGLLVIENRSLAHLQYAEGNLTFPSQTLSLPSWCVDYSRVWLPGNSYKLFHAYGREVFREHWGSRILAGPYLHVFGVRVGQVSKVWHYEGNRQHSDQIKLLSDSLDAEHVLNCLPTRSQKFWRVLMHGLFVPRNNDPVRRLHPDDMDYIMEWWHDHVVPSLVDVTNKKSPPDNMAVRSMSRMPLLKYQSTYFLTDSGHLGSRKGKVLVGDEVYILLGSEAPVLLRRDLSPRIQNDPSETSFEFAGQCYLDGAMDGEIVSGEHSWKSIVLC